MKDNYNLCIPNGSGSPSGGGGDGGGSGSQNDAGTAPTPSGPNSGAICNFSPNQCAQGEQCLTVGGGGPKGMCLAKCQKKGADCPTSGSNQKSVCFMDAPGSSFCAFMCEYNGSSYTCPSGTKCQPLGAGTSICVQ
jgi:hypothetical protein